MARPKQKQPKRGARKPNPSKPKQKAEELPPKVPEDTPLSIGNLMAKVGRQQIELESALEREGAVRQQLDELRGRMVEAGIAFEPESNEDGSETDAKAPPLPTPSD
jgi:hypothetical protein